jgi:hypothetical protein
MGAVPAGGNIWKSIIIGVLTTVTAYVIVHFIFDKKEDEGFKKKKEATVGGWKAIIKSNEFYLDDYYAVFCKRSNEDQVKNLQRVIDKQISDYELVQKKPDLDDDLGLYINRYLDRCRDMKVLLQDYYAAIAKVENDSNYYGQMKKLRLAEVDSNYMPRVTGLLAQDSNKIGALYTELTKKYGDEFKPLQKPAVTDKVIIGSWGDGVTKFKFEPDHSFIMTGENGREFPGKWSLAENTLTVTYPNEGSVYYHIIYYGPDYLRFTVNDFTDERQVCRQ